MIISLLKVDDRLHAHGFMLTWQGRWGEDIPAVKQLMGSRLHWKIMVDLVQKSSFYQALWHVFKYSCLVMARENKLQNWQDGPLFGAQA